MDLDPPPASGPGAGFPDPRPRRGRGTEDIRTRAGDPILFSSRFTDNLGDVRSGFFPSAPMLKQVFQQLLYRLVQPLMALAARTGVRPNHLTLAGLACNAVALWVFARGAGEGWAATYRAQWQGAARVLARGLFDKHDGRQAPLTGNATRSGAFFDSVLDRWAELLMFAGFGWLAWGAGRPQALLATYAAAAASLMVSYTRARIEGLGGGGSVGLFQRPERIVLLCAAAIAAGALGPGGLGASPEGPWRLVFEPALWVVAGGAALTAVHRLWHGMRTLS